MGNLIKIKFTKKASEYPEECIKTIYNKFPDFFKGSEIVEKDTENDKFFLKIYVNKSDNATSRFCVNEISKNSRIFKVEML